MKLLGNRDCVDGFRDTESISSTSAGSGGGEGGGGAVVVVGVKLNDAKSKELLTWALVKVAKSGDRVIALHVLDPDTVHKEDKNGTLLSLVKTFDPVLVAYEGFCNLKQVELKFKVCRGKPVRKILAHEVKSFGATSLILGPSEIPHTIRSTISVAKSCAKKLPKKVSVIAVDNGKILFQRLGVIPSLQSIKSKKKLLRISPRSLDSCDNSMAIVPYSNGNCESKSGWEIIRKVFMHKNGEKRSKKIKKWLSRLPSRAIYPDYKNGEGVSNLEEEEDSNCALVPNELEGLFDKYLSICRLFSYQELSSATSNFAPENLIGKGGTSQVYKGYLQDGTKLAVKVLKSSHDILNQFSSEIEIITAFNHKNIISLFGFCFENNNLLLVYDLLPKGSLEENLHGTVKNENFGWNERFKVAIGVSKALEHLHNSNSDPIIHRDVKSSNILLSDDFEPKLSDFGLATLASNSCSHMDNFDIAGTFGYLAPEYFMHGRLNEMIDVYAFGVVLLELLSGRKPIDNQNSKGQESLVMWAKRILKLENYAQLLDPVLNNSYNHEEFKRMVLASTLCIRQTPMFRPHMNLVVKLLEGDEETIKWGEEEINSCKEDEAIDEENSSPRNIQDILNLALLNIDDDSISSNSNSTQQIISVEDYLHGRWSRTSSFD